MNQYKDFSYVSYIFTLSIKDFYTYYDACADAKKDDEINRWKDRFIHLYVLELKAGKTGLGSFDSWFKKNVSFSSVTSKDNIKGDLTEDERKAKANRIREETKNIGKTKIK